MKARFVINDQVWIYTEARGPVGCRTCGGGGLILADSAEDRVPCGPCRGSGTVEGWIADVIGPLRVRSTSFIHGIGWRYGIWIGSSFEEVSEERCYSSPAAAKLRAQLRRAENDQTAAVETETTEVPA